MLSLPFIKVVLNTGSLKMTGGEVSERHWPSGSWIPGRRTETSAGVGAAFLLSRSFIPDFKNQSCCCSMDMIWGQISRDTGFVLFRETDFAKTSPVLDPFQKQQQFSAEGVGTQRLWGCICRCCVPRSVFLASWSTAICHPRLSLTPTIFSFPFIFAETSLPSEVFLFTPAALRFGLHGCDAVLIIFSKKTYSTLPFYVWCAEVASSRRLGSLRRGIFRRQHSSP